MVEASQEQNKNKSGGFVIFKNDKNIINKICMVILLSVIMLTAACTSKKKVIDDDFAVDSAEAGFSDADLAVDGSPDKSVRVSETSVPVADEFSDFDEKPKTGKTDVAKNTNESDDLEKELNSISDAPAAAPVAEVPVPVVETKPIEITPPPPVVETPAPIVETPVPVAPVAETPAQVIETPAKPVEIVALAVVSKISNIQYKGNSNGGTVIISSNNPLTYTTRVNSSTNQVIVEVQNAVVSNHLKRPLNTKDMSSSIGHVDVYQKNNSKVARFVVQLRPNSPEPLVQPEGNSLLIIGSAVEGSGPNPSKSESVAQNTNETSISESASSVSNNADINSEMASKGIMNSDDLEEFLTNNNKFYGKKISIETTEMDVRDVLKFISEESGVNMVFDTDVSGKSALKLRKVPWDQALVILLKSQKLGYRRQGSILRIAKQESLVKEDETAIKLKEAKAVVEPLIVRNFSVNYTDIDKLETKIKDFIADNKKDSVTRGRVTSDSRTNMLIVTETATKLDHIAQLIKALDTQPQQVMIEARIIEASESYTKTIGGSIGANRSLASPSVLAPGAVLPSFTNQRIVSPMGEGSGNYGSPSFNITPPKAQNGSFIGNLFFGTLGAFGNLDAQLALDELEDRVKILSSPRVAVLTNTTAAINQGVTILQPSSTATAATAGATPVTTYNPTKVGVSLKVTPQISNIGTVRLQLDVSRTSPKPGVQDIDDRSVKTEVIVKSGDTAVIGGVFQSDVLTSKQGVPGLRDIPILGTFFKGDTNTNQKVELMIFVTPKIIPLLNQVFKADSTPEPAAEPVLDIK